MSQLVQTLKNTIRQQILKEALAKPRTRVNTIRIASHDREQELVIGGQAGDISYSIVSTTLNYEPPA